MERVSRTNARTSLIKYYNHNYGRGFQHTFPLWVTLFPKMIVLFSYTLTLIIDYLPIKGADPHCQFAQIGSRIVDDGFIHVVPKTNALRCWRSRQVPRHEHAAIPRLLDGISRKANVIPIRIAGGMISLKRDNIEFWGYFLFYLRIPTLPFIFKTNFALHKEIKENRLKLKLIE